MEGNYDPNLSLAWSQQELEEKASIINGISDAIMLLDANTYVEECYKS